MLECVCLCFLVCMNAGEHVLPAANRCPLEGMWNLRQRTGEREKERALGKDFALSPFFNLTFFICRFVNFQWNVRIHSLGHFMHSLSAFKDQKLLNTVFQNIHIQNIQIKKYTLY